MRDPFVGIGKPEPLRGELSGYWSRRIDDDFSIKGSHPFRATRLKNPVTMRLTQEQIKFIKQTAHAVLGNDARVILFGSRVDDAKKGGDIDLLFETDHLVSNRASTIGAIYVALIRQFGDRKIDILLKDSATTPAPVLEIARQTGIQL